MKKKDVLTLFGCSSSLIVAILSGNSANANPVTPQYTEYVFTSPLNRPLEVAENSDLSDCSCSSNDLEADFTDKEGELAIANYGCDCAGCRYIVRSRLTEGSL